MSYVLLLTQKGDGCDYMIDCGKTWQFLEAENDKDALQEADKILRDYGGGSGPSDEALEDCEDGEEPTPRENQIAEFDLFRTGFLTDDLVAYIKKQIVANKKKAEKKAVSAKEKAKQEKDEQDKKEYERLKRKFELGEEDPEPEPEPEPQPEPQPAFETKVFYTIGDVQVYERWFKRDPNLYLDAGAAVWNTIDKAEQFFIDNPEQTKGYAIYGVIANWRRDTRPNPDPNATWHNLVVRCKLTHLENVVYG